MLIVSPEPIGRIRTGVGIRLSEMARVLGRDHDVTLAAPQVEGAPSTGYRLVSTADLGSLVGASDVLVVHGHASNDVLDLEREELLRIPGLTPEQADALNAFLSELSDEEGEESPAKA